MGTPQIEIFTIAHLVPFRISYVAVSHWRDTKWCSYFVTHLSYDISRQTLKRNLKMMFFFSNLTFKDFMSKMSKR